MDKVVNGQAVYIYTLEYYPGILLSNKMGQTTNTCNNIGDSQKSMLFAKPDPKGYIMNDTIFM